MHAPVSVRPARRLASRSRSGRLLLVPLAALLLSACGGNSNGNSAAATNGGAPAAPPAAPPAVTTTTVGIAGGTVVSPDGSLTLTIPAGALAADLDITITELSAGEAPAEFDGLGVERYFELGPAGTTFTVPIGVTLTGVANPMTNATTLSSALRFLLTSDGSTAEFLGEPAMTLSGGTAPDVTLSGQLGHFSPLVSIDAIIGNLGLSDFAQVSVSGVPRAARIGAEIPITVDVLSGDFLFVGGRICGAPIAVDGEVLFEPSQREGCSDFPRGSDSEVFLLSANGDGSALSATEPFSCAGENANTLRAGATLQLAEDQPSAVFSGLITPTFATVYIGSSVDCTFNTPPPPPPPEDPLQITILEQVLPLPGNAVSPESVRSFRVDQSGPRFVSNTTVPIALPKQAVLVAVEGGSLIVDAITGDILFDQSSPSEDPQFGAELIARPAAGDEVVAAILQFGPAIFGGFLRGFDNATDTFSGFGQLRQNRHTDAVPSCGTPPLCDELVVSRSSDVGFIVYDSVFDGFDYLPDTLPASRFGNRSPLSAVALEAGGPVLVLTGDRLYLDDRAGIEATLIATVDGSPRKIRCAHGSNVCAISQFDNDTLLPVIWDGASTPTIGTPITVADGPVSMDLLVDEETGNTLVVSTGFNDDRFALTELAPDGSEVSTIFRDAQVGCTSPAHASFVPNANPAGDAAVLSSCFDSNSLFTFFFP